MNFDKKSFKIRFFQRGTPMNFDQKSFKMSFFQGVTPMNFGRNLCFAIKDFVLYM